ncbi:MAG: DUF1217 domain-containing protein [Rhodobacteraceae bacterium]|nr:DUF1217 domain-containing protein [Paracoccaceae bacterium]
MSFAPALPLTGYAGWALLKRTMPAQSAAWAAQPVVRSDEAYFREKIGAVSTAEQLVADRRLLKVALGAFGLGDEINNRYFIRKVLEDGTLKTGALANKLADKTWAKFSAAFGFGDYSTPRTKLSDFPDKILAAYRTRGFEEAVGEQREEMRLALNAERELAELARKPSSATTKWYTILGDAPMRKVFETALGLPSGFGRLDIDQQLGVIRAKSQDQLGVADPSGFQDPAAMDKLVRRFLIRAEVAEGARLTGPAQTALTLLRGY